jgi:hypothetical protein
MAAMRREAKIWASDTRAVGFVMVAIGPGLADRRMTKIGHHGSKKCSSGDGCPIRTTLLLSRP